MTMLYQFLSLFAWQLFLTTPSVIGKEHAKNREDFLSKTSSESTEPKIQPFLIMKERKAPDLDAHNVRAKRNIQPRKVEEEKGCRRENFIVHTKDRGLSTTFIQPESFNAYQCRGKCSLTSWKKFVNHSLLRAYLEKIKDAKTDDEACCVPSNCDRRHSFITPTSVDHS